MKILIFSFLVFFASTSVNAQDKYDFLNITYDTDKEGIYVSLNGKEFSGEPVVLVKKDNSSLNANPLINKVSEYQDKGWEIINLNSYPIMFKPGTLFQKIIYFHVAYLRKKKA